MMIRMAVIMLVIAAIASVRIMALTAICVLRTLRSKTGGRSDKETIGLILSNKLVPEIANKTTYHMLLACSFSGAGKLPIFLLSPRAGRGDSFGFCLAFD